MKTLRLLLPFTYGVDACAIDSALRLAKGRDAILVPLALIAVPGDGQSKGARLEYVQQSKDFLEAVQCKAARYGVPLERVEVFTSDVVQSIGAIASEMECEGVLLFIGGKHGVLLTDNEIKRLMEHVTCRYYILRLPSDTSRSLQHGLRARFSSWLLRKPERSDGLVQAQDWSEKETIFST